MVRRAASGQHAPSDDVESVRVQCGESAAVATGQYALNGVPLSEMMKSCCRIAEMSSKIGCKLHTSVLLLAATG